MDLMGFTFQKMLAFLLVLSRTAGIFTLTPVFGANQVPVRARVGFAFALAILFVPMVQVSGEIPSNTILLVVMLIREALIGLAIGFFCSLIFSGINMAGEFMDLQSGFSFATVLDPNTGTPSAVMARFQYLFGILLLLVTNMHYVIIRGIADSFRIAPIGSLSINLSAAGGVLNVFVSIFLIAIQIAMPVIAATFIADISLAIVSKVVPQMNILIVGFPLKLGMGLLALVISLPMIMGASNGLFSDMYGYIMRLTRLVTA